MPVKVVYTCYGGTHSSPVAAAIHLGWLPADREPVPEELLRVPRFDRAKSGDFGRIERMGRDEAGHDVYVLGRGPRPEPVERAFMSGYMAAGGDPRDVFLVCTLSCVNGAMRLGGFMSRRVGWVTLGRPIAVWGTRRAYMALVRLVLQTKEALKVMEAERK